jgi:hypothetical protein
VRNERLRAGLIGGATGVVIGVLGMLGLAAVADALEAVTRASSGRTPSREEVVSAALNVHAERYDAPKGTHILTNLHQFKGGCYGIVEVAFFGDELPSERVNYLVTFRQADSYVALDVNDSFTGWYDEAQPVLEPLRPPCA